MFYFAQKSLKPKLFSDLLSSKAIEKQLIVPF